VRPVDHQFTSPRKYVQQELCSTGKTAHAGEAPSKPLAVDDRLLLPEREVHVEISINWFLDQDILSHPKRLHV